MPLFRDCPVIIFKIYTKSKPAKIGSVGTDKSIGVFGMNSEIKTDKGVKNTTIRSRLSILIKANQNTNKIKGKRMP